MKNYPLSLRRRNILGSILTVLIMVLLFFVLDNEHRYTSNQFNTFASLFIIVLVFLAYVVPAWKAHQARLVVKSIVQYSGCLAIITGIANLMFLSFIDSPYADAAAKVHFLNPVVSSLLVVAMIFILTITLTGLSSLIIHGVKRKGAQFAH